jgi:hypothetical protein
VADEFVVEFGVEAVGLKQGFVRAALDNFAVVEHEDLMRFANGAESMSDDESCSAAQQQFESPLQSGFGHGIDRAGRFIQHDDSRVRQNRASEAYNLALSQG